MREVLVRLLRAREVVVGFNHTFGRGARGTTDLLRTLAGSLGIAVHVVPPLSVDGVVVSSSSVRDALRRGDVSVTALAAAHARRVAEFAAKTRLATVLQLVIGRHGLAVHVARRLTRHPEALDQLMGIIGDFVPARQALSPRFLAGLLI